MTSSARIGMAATCLAVALLAGAAAFLGVFARGSGAFIPRTAARRPHVRAADAALS